MKILKFGLLYLKRDFHLLRCPTNFRSLKNHHLLKNASVYQQRNIIFKMNNATPPRVVGYYVIFPAIPDESMENNTFLANILSNNDWPALKSASPKEMYEGTVRMLMEYGATVYEHNELLESKKTLSQSFDTILEPLLAEEYDIDYAFSTLVLKMLTDWPECSNQAFNVDLYHLKTIAAREHMEKLVGKEFQNALQSIYKSNELINNQWKQRLVEWFLLEIRSAGFDVHNEKKKKILTSWSRFIDEYSTKYITNIMCTNDQVVFNIASKDFLKHAPPHALKILSKCADKTDTGPWKAYMEPLSIYTVLNYCSDRQIRNMIWDRWISKASFEHDFYNNSVVIEELRHNNEGMAKILGYSSIAEHRLSNKMAGTAETVRSFLNELIRRIRPVFVDRMQSWNLYAQNNEMINENLKPYDLFYMCKREAEAHYNVNSIDLMKYFPFWPTFNNILEILSHLFNLSFKDISQQNLEKCHPSVKIYSLFDQSTNEHLGRLYFDPFDRPSKRGSWQTILGRPANIDRNLDKIVYLIGAANEPNNNNVSLLHYTQLKNLLFNLGRAIQYFLSRSPYREITIPTAPRFASDWDGADYFPTFVEFFVFKPNLLSAISSPHLETGELLLKKADNVCLALSRSTLWETYRTLFWSDYDLSICELEDRRKKFWFDMYCELYSEYFPFERERNNYQPCSFIPIHMQPFMSMYYRKLWSEMLALDIHETFYQEKNEKLTGERLKNVVLNAGASETQSVLYRTFQGRDPSIGGICDFYDPLPQIKDK